MVNCCAINRNNSSKKKKGDDVKGWHIVPYKENEKELRKKWLHALKRDPPYPENDKNFVVCGLHFDDNSFKRDLRYELCGGKRAFVRRRCAFRVYIFYEC